MNKTEAIPPASSIYLWKVQACESTGFQGGKYGEIISNATVYTQAKHQADIIAWQNAIFLLSGNQNSVLAELESRDPRQNNIVKSSIKENTDGSVEHRKPHDTVKVIIGDIGAEDASVKHFWRAYVSSDLEMIDIIW